MAGDVRDKLAGGPDYQNLGAQDVNTTRTRTGSLGDYNGEVIKDPKVMKVYDKTVSSTSDVESVSGKESHSVTEITQKPGGPKEKVTKSFFRGIFGQNKAEKDLDIVVKELKKIPGDWGNINTGNVLKKACTDSTLLDHLINEFEKGGISIFTPDKHGHTLLYYGINSDNDEIRSKCVNVLLMAGHNPDEVDIIKHDLQKLLDGKDADYKKEFLVNIISGIDIKSDKEMKKLDREIYGLMDNRKLKNDPGQQEKISDLKVKQTKIMLEKISKISSTFDVIAGECGVGQNQYKYLSAIHGLALGHTTQTNLFKKACPENAEMGKELKGSVSLFDIVISTLKSAKQSPLQPDLNGHTILYHGLKSGDPEIRRKCIELVLYGTGDKDTDAVANNAAVRADIRALINEGKGQFLEDISVCINEKKNIKEDMATIIEEECGMEPGKLKGIEKTKYQELMSGMLEDLGGLDEPPEQI